MAGIVCAWMGEPSQYVTSHPFQLSLAILSWVGAMSVSNSSGISRARCTGRGLAV